MGNESNKVLETEFIFRRLTEGLQFNGKDVNPYIWLAILIPIMVVAMVYVSWMYRRDAVTVGWRAAERLRHGPAAEQFTFLDD